MSPQWVKMWQKRKTSKNCLPFWGLNNDFLFSLNFTVNFSVQPTKSATFCGNLPKTYSMICLAFDDEDKNSKSRKVTKKSSFISWGLKNKLKSASTLSLPTADHASTLPWNKPYPTFPSSSSYNNDSALYWASCRLPAVCKQCAVCILKCVQYCVVPVLDLLWIMYSTGALWCSNWSCSVCSLCVTSIMMTLPAALESGCAKYCMYG